MLFFTPVCYRSFSRSLHQMLLLAFAAEVPVAWVVGDTVYGYDELRLLLEERQKNYVLAVPETHAVWVQGRQQSVGLLAALLPQDRGWYFQRERAAKDGDSMSGPGYNSLRRSLQAREGDVGS